MRNCCGRCMVSFCCKQYYPLLPLHKPPVFAGLGVHSFFPEHVHRLHHLPAAVTQQLGGVCLVLGQNYYVRVYSNGAAFNFYYCITDPHMFAVALFLNVSTVCNNIPGNMYGSTITAPTTIRHRIAQPHLLQHATYGTGL